MVTKERISLKCIRALRVNSWWRNCSFPRSWLSSFIEAEGGFGEVDTDIILRAQNSSSLTLIVLAHHSCHYGLIGAHCQKKCLWRAAQIGRNEPKCLEGTLTVYPFIKMAAVGLPHWGLSAPRTWDFERIYSARYPDINSLLWNRPQVQLESGCSPYNNHCLHCSNGHIMPGRSVWHARPSIS